MFEEGKKPILLLLIQSNILMGKPATQESYITMDSNQTLPSSISYQQLLSNLIAVLSKPAERSSPQGERSEWIANIWCLDFKCV